MANNHAIYLTPEGQKKLEEELDYLVNVRRKEVAERLHEAMEDGELIENAEYEAAKNEQAFVEGRILEIDHILAQALVVEPSKNSDEVAFGSTVVIKEGNKKPQTFKIVGVAESDPSQGMISNESPLGKALLGKKVGEYAEVQAPAGTIRYKIVEIK